MPQTKCEICAQREEEDARAIPAILFMFVFFYLPLVVICYGIQQFFELIGLGK